ncbi:MAG: hypothetical protein ACJ788_00195 [Ktedonobacteraceae bacterium]
MIMTFIFGFVAGCVATLTVFFILASFEKHVYDGPKQIEKHRQRFRYGSPVYVTRGTYQGMYGTISSERLLFKWFVVFPTQPGGKSDAEWIKEGYLRINVPD